MYIKDSLVEYLKLNVIKLHYNLIFLLCFLFFKKLKH